MIPRTSELEKAMGLQIGRKIQDCPRGKLDDKDMALQLDECNVLCEVHYRRGYYDDIDTDLSISNFRIQFEDCREYQIQFDVASVMEYASEGYYNNQK